MNKNFRIFLGLVSGLVLILLNNPQLQESFGSARGWFTQILFGFLTFVGLIMVIYCSFWLIVDSVKAIFKK